MPSLGFQGGRVSRVEPLAGVVIAILVAVLAVRALRQTDLNPVSGVGKLPQVRLVIYPQAHALALKPSDP